MYSYPCLTPRLYWQIYNWDDFERSRSQPLQNTNKICFTNYLVLFDNLKQLLTSIFQDIFPLVNVISYQYYDFFKLHLVTYCLSFKTLNLTSLSTVTMQLSAAFSQYATLSLCSIRVISSILYEFYTIAYLFTYQYATKSIYATLNCIYMFSLTTIEEN